MLLISLLSLGLAVLFTPALWLRLDGWVQNQRDQIWARLESSLGQKVVYDRIAPNVLAALDFQNVRLLADDGSTLFQAASVRLSWDWERLFQGRFSEALRRVQIINAVITLDSHRDQAILERWAAFFRPSGGEGQTSFDFTVEGFNLRAQWTDGQRTLALDRGFAVLSPEGNEWGLKFRGALSWQDRSTASTYAKLTVHGEARSDAAFQNLSLRTDVASVQTSWFDLEPLSVQVTVDPSEVIIAKVSDRTPLDLQVIWTPAQNRWSFQGVAEGFRPSQLIRIKGQKSWSGLADGTISGRFSYQWGADFAFSGQASWPVGSLPAPLAGEALSVRGRVASHQASFEFQDFHLETASIALTFDGTVGPDFLPDGAVSLERWALPAGGEVRGKARLVRTGSVVSFSGENWVWNTLGTKAPSGWIEKAGEGWKFSLQGPWDGAEVGRFSADGAFFPAESRLEAAFEVSSLPLAALKDSARGFLPDLIVPPEFLPLEATCHGFVEWQQSGGLTLALTSFRVNDTMLSGRSVSGSALWQGTHLDLTLDQGVWDSFRGSGALSVDIEDNGAIGGTLVGVLWDRPFDLSGRWVPMDHTLVFSGKPGISGVIHQTEAGVWLAQLSLEPQEVLPGWTLGFQGLVTLDGDRWTVGAERMTLRGRYPWNQEAFSARARVRADSTFFRFDDLVINDSHGSWMGAGISSWSTDFSVPWAGRLALTSSASVRESLNLDWVGTAPDRWHGAVRASGVDLGRASLPALAGLSGRITLAGSGEWDGTEATWNLQTALSEARYGDSPVGFRASFSGTSRRISIRNLNLSLAPLRVVDGTADLDGELRLWKASLGVGLRIGAGDWESRWALKGGWTPEGSPFRIFGELASRANTWSQRSFPDWALTASWGPGSWEAVLGEGAVSARGNADGTFTIGARSPFPIQGDAQGSWKGGALLLDVKGFRADLALLKDFVNSKLFAVSSGVAEGDFTVGGSPVDLEINGVLVARGLAVTSSFVRQPVGPLDVPVIFEGHRLRIDPINIGPGTQTWIFSGGARLDHLLPEEYQFSIQTDPLSVIPVSYQYTGISATGSVAGLLVLKGNPFAVTLGGRLVVQDTIITLKPSSPETASGDPLGFSADLTLVTGRKVEFFWPNETLPLLRAVANPGQNLVVKANDMASTWSVNGKLALKTGAINYLNRLFVLKEGELSFQEDQTSFDPRISVRAELKVRETTGTVTINLRADDRLSQFSPRFDAVPYKSAEELQQLVGTTLSLPTDYKATNIDTALSVASDVGTSFLLTPLEEAVRKNFQLDLFTLKTEILKKTLLNRNAALGASDYLDNTRLFFGKYIGDDLFLQGTLAFRRDTTVATQVSPKMVVEPEFQMEFQTPFFLLNWTLLPQHPETLFVTDNTVTFRWNWSY